jgi:hypothetical protein
MEERKELSFEQKKEELIRFLGSRKNRQMALATSSDDRVQARMILIASEGSDIYFFHMETLSEIKADREERKSRIVQRHNPDRRNS